MTNIPLCWRFGESCRLPRQSLVHWGKQKIAIFSDMVLLRKELDYLVTIKFCIGANVIFGQLCWRGSQF